MTVSAVLSMTVFRVLQQISRGTLLTISFYFFGMICWGYTQCLLFKFVPKRCCLSKMQKNYSHLTGLPLDAYQDISPRFLIGLDNCKLGHIIKSREAKQNEPTTVETCLGRTVYGNCTAQEKTIWQWATNTTRLNNSRHEWGYCESMNTFDSQTVKRWIFGDGSTWNIEWTKIQGYRRRWRLWSRNIWTSLTFNCRKTPRTSNAYMISSDLGVGCAATV